MVPGKNETWGSEEKEGKRGKEKGERKKGKGKMGKEKEGKEKGKSDFFVNIWHTFIDNV